ncbi:Alpha/Beta hydrolase protein [Dichotomopilus funicola]|uniref:Alpha/Beta hydrolase protein n=1 Tax=Dichotomopilus funicola TaxID=1934379 RepID=A0AAN6UZN8_9PEZI|nr:Alpha/Beta hydrolase protein [Dichotomopilus funicola]
MQPKTSFLVLSAISAASAQSADPTGCNEVQIFIAVGHGETFPGGQQSIAEQVCAGRSSCAYSNIDYPATAGGDYCQIATDAINTAVSDITDYVAGCPDAKIVLSGWSQGGWIVTDIISGGGGPGGGVAAGCTQADTAPLDPTTSPGSNVVAVAVYGDPRHTGGQTFNEGTAAATDGVWPREGDQLAAQQLWADKLRSYCAAGDPACANGQDWNAHGSYFGDYASTPAAWINSVIDGSA